VQEETRDKKNAVIMEAVNNQEKTIQEIRWENKYLKQTVAEFMDFQNMT
jgi:hypothetical protein